MTPLFFSLGNRLRLMVIPDTEFHLDGHAVLTHTYSIYRDSGKGGQIQSKEKALHLDHNTDPDYLGVITFEEPGKLFSYTHNDGRILTHDEIEEIIEHLTHIRDNPANWQHLNDL
jgi:hypothetical protein